MTTDTIGNHQKLIFQVRRRQASDLILLISPTTDVSVCAHKYQGLCGISG
jgi:hypothetical protein